MACTTLTSQDGGLLIILALDAAGCLLLFAATWLFWEWWVDSKERKAQEIVVSDAATEYDSILHSDDDVSLQSSPSFAEEEAGVPDKLIWYKFLLQIWSIDEDVLRRHHGHDGLLYIKFSYALQAFVISVVIVSCGFLIPVYFFCGSEQSTIFGQLTIRNLSSDSGWLWAPTLAAPLILVIAVLIMENFRTKLIIEAPNEVDHVVLIQGIKWDADKLRSYLQTIDLNDSVIDMQYVYDVERAYEINDERKKASRMELRYMDLAEEGDEEAKEEVVEHSGCLCCLKIEEPALQYWTQQKLELNQQLLEEVPRSERVPKMFVVWDKRIDVLRMINAHKFTALGSAIYKKPFKWNISKAPVYYDINWENLAMSNGRWWTRAVLINIAVFILIVFFTTPIIIALFLYDLFFSNDDEVITSALVLDVDEAADLLVDSYYDAQRNSDDVISTSSTSSSLLAEYGTIIILLIIEAIIPQLVNLSCSLERHRTKTSRNSWCIWKVFIYLVIAELFMPAFGYSSLAALLEGYFATDDLLSNWSCVFESYRLSFMCKIVLSAALLGRAIELLNPWGIASFYYWLFEHRTRREYKQIFIRMRDRFNIGYNYAKLVAYIAISVSFGVIVPLITLIGLLFVYCKYSVDMYLMVYFHRPCASYGVACHQAASTYVIFAACLLQFFMMVYDFLYIGITSIKTILSASLVVFIISIYYYGLWTSFLGWLFPERAYVDIDKDGAAEDRAEVVGMYLPPFMRKDTHIASGVRPRITVLKKPRKEHRQMDLERQQVRRHRPNYGAAVMTKQGAPEHGEPVTDSHEKGSQN